MISDQILTNPHLYRHASLSPPLGQEPAEDCEGEGDEEDVGFEDDPEVELPKAGLCQVGMTGFGKL